MEKWQRLVPVEIDFEATPLAGRRHDAMICALA